MNKTPTTLIIMDGFGLAPAADDNAVTLAKTPVLDKLFKEYAHTTLSASGLDVGLPAGQMGNSEVGHTNIGGGRVVFQDLPRISRAIEDGSFFRNEAYNKAMDDCLAKGTSLHLYGLLSDGGVHSHIEHLFALLQMAKDKGLTKVYIHCFLDGRDVSPTSGKGFVQELQDKCAQIGVGKIATVMGRYYAMDRDKRWDRVQKAWETVAHGACRVEGSAAQLVQDSYDGGVTDEFVVPKALEERGVCEGDSVVFFNFRPDRARELTRAFCDESFAGFDRGEVPKVSFVCLTEYDPDIDAPVAFPKEFPRNVLADVLAENGVTRYQARQVIDSIFKDEEIDPAVDYVQPSHAVADDGALCTYNDVSYFFKKLVKYTNNAWEYSTDNVLKMIVSYDDFGETVGFDAELPQFTEVLPYEGAFTYSVKHDENEQPIVTSHGELQLLNDQRLVGDVKMKGGLDVNGVKDSSLNGYLDLKDTKADTAMGLGVNSVSHFVVEPDDDGADVEHFTGSVALSYRDNGEDEYSLIAAVEGNTKTDGDAFATLADVSLTLTDIFKLGANVTLEQADYEEIEFAGGQAIDMTQLTDAQLDQIQNEVTQQAAKLSASLVLHPGVLANLLTLVGD